MLRVVAFGVVTLVVLPAVAAADPIPINGIIDPHDDYGQSVRLDNGAGHRGAGVGGGFAGGAYAAAGGRTSPLGLLYASAASLVGLPPLAPSASGSDTGNVGPLVLGGSNGSSGNGGGSSGLHSTAPAGTAPGSASAPQILQAFRDALGRLTPSAIESSPLASFVGAMEATDVMPVGGGETLGALAETGVIPEIHASEPASLLLFGSGLLALAHRQRAKRAVRR
jgi:hypothetical protein